MRHAPKPLAGQDPHQGCILLTLAQQRDPLDEPPCPSARDGSVPERSGRWRSDHSNEALVSLRGHDAAVIPADEAVEEALLRVATTSAWSLGVSAAPAAPAAAEGGAASS